ncbi:MAG: hypothetical protein Q8P45_00130 [Candidatus Harrisonbacteria bacterium]|nr:hypothetical protein [Candidatus Harrisonbacteria bacterium]
MDEQVQMNPLQGSAAPENHQDSRKGILFLLIGVLLGAVLMWFLFPFISPSYLNEEEKTELLNQHGVGLLESFEAQRLEERKSMMGTVESINTENSLLVLSVNKGNALILIGEDEEQFPTLTETKVSVAVEISEETKLYKINQEISLSQEGEVLSQQDSKLPASLSDIKVGSRVTVTSRTPLENLNVGVTNYVYAAQIFIF